LATAFRDDRHVTSNALLAIVERIARPQRREPVVVG
jgi:hypothetical protein